MDRERVMARVEQLLKEKHMSMNALMKETEISTTMYQWKKNASRDATRSPSLKSIEKICQFFGISLSYFFAENESEENEVKTRELIAMLSRLNKAQLDVLTDFLREFTEKLRVWTFFFRRVFMSRGLPRFRRKNCRFCAFCRGRNPCAVQSVQLFCL